MAGLSLEDGMRSNAGQVACRTTEEEDMAYFERRYQARVSEPSYSCRHLACLPVHLAYIMEPYLCVSSYGIVILVEGRKRASQTAKVPSIKKINRGKHWAPEHKQCCQEDCTQ